MKFSNPDLLVYIGIADAYAMATEYLKQHETERILERCLLFEAYVAHPRYGSGKGRYTDDTEMSVANVRVLNAYQPPFRPIMFANAYVAEFAYGGRRKGYSRRFQSLLEEVTTGPELLMRLDPASNKNGAAMRSVPIGALRSVTDVLAVAELQAKITHDTPEGIWSARAVALMSHYALYEAGPLSELPEYCLAYLPGEDHERFGHVFRNRWPNVPVTEKENASVAVTTVHAVLDLVAHDDRSLMEILKQTLVWGGDTDSVAAIAWGIASARRQDERLPAFMRADLEGGNSRTGIERLRRLGAALMEKFGS